MSTIMRRPLNVAEDRIPETRNRILGEMSNISVISFNSATQSDKEVLQNNQPAGPAIDTEYFQDDEEDEDALSDENAGRNNDSRCFLQQLARPLVLGIRQVVIKQPEDPTDYLIRWLLNYQSYKEQYENKEKLAIEAKDDEEEEEEEDEEDEKRE